MSACVRVYVSPRAYASAVNLTVCWYLARYSYSEHGALACEQALDLGIGQEKETGEPSLVLGRAERGESGWGSRLASPAVSSRSPQEPVHRLTARGSLDHSYRFVRLKR